MSSKILQRNNDTEKIGIIIPTLNEEKSIGHVLNDIKNLLSSFSYEIVVVDGRSSDKTVEIAKTANARVIYQKKKGYGEALFAGYVYATKELNCDILVTLDADGTYAAKDSVKIINMIMMHDADYVVGRRSVNSQNMTASHRFGNRVISWLIRNLLKINIHDTQCGLFAFRSYLIDNIDLRQYGWAVNTEMLTKASDLGMIISETNISYSERIGATKGNTIRGGLVNLQVILRMMRDSNPLLLFSLMGLALTSSGIWVGVIVVSTYLETGIVTRPNLTLLSALLIIAGIQLFSMGMMADMMRKRQQYRIKMPHNLYNKI